MKRLLDGRFPESTHVWGFVDASLDAIVDAYRTGRIKRPIKEQFKPLQGDLATLLGQMGDPHDYGYLLVETKSRWIAIFDSHFSASPSNVRFFAHTLHCAGLIVGCIEHTFNPTTRTGQLGMVQFCLLARGYDPSSTRDLSVAYDGEEIETFRWQFEQYGEPLAFEQIEKYTAPDDRDRFTCEMLEDYCRALGIDLFNEQFYGPRAVLFY